MTSRPLRPPRLAERCLRRLLPPGEAGEALRGDLFEEFVRRGDSIAARLWYWRQAMAAIARLGWRGWPRPPRLAVTGLVDDARQAVRGHLRSPGFTAAVVVILALGIGASTAIFALVDGILLRRLPFAEPDRLIWMSEVTAAGDVTSVSWLDYVDWRARAQSFERLAASRADQFTMTGAEQATRLAGRRVTADFFQVLGVSARTGRLFEPADDLANAAPVAVISAELHRRLGDAAAGIGRALWFDGRAFTVVGILPDGFKYLRPYDVFVSNGPYLLGRAMTERADHFGYVVIGRLKAGVAIDAAFDEMARIEADISREHPEAGTVRIALAPLASRLVSDIRQTLLALLAAVSLLLLIACVNVASLLTARAATRQRELAMRAALGASRLRLLRQWFIESAVLAAAGACGGAGLAVVLLRGLVALAPPDTPRIDEVRLDAQALMFASAATLVCAIVCAVIPALQALSRRETVLLTSAPRSGSTAVSRKVRAGLIVVEVATAFVLLTGAGLMARTMARLSAVDPGFVPDHLLTFRVSLRDSRWTDEGRVAFVGDLLSRARRLPGAIDAAAVSSLPIDGSGWNNVFTIQGRPAPPNHNDLPRTAITPATARYFETMRMRITRGRSIDEHDTAASTPVVVINENLARRGWPSGDPIGQRIKWGWAESPGTWRTVVGVAADLKMEGLADPTLPQLFLPYTQVPESDLAIVVRTASDPDTMIRPVLGLVGDMDRDVPVYSVRAMDRILGDSVARPRMSAFVFVVFAGVAVVLAAAGLFALVARMVIARTHEIGVRIALGAERRHVMGSVMQEGLVLAAGGTLVGLVSAMLTGGLLRDSLFGVGPTDPVTLGAVTGLVMAASATACVIPALRATRVDPIRALRAD